MTQFKWMCFVCKESKVVHVLRNCSHRIPRESISIQTM